MSLRFRLNFLIALTLTAIVGVGALIALHNARRSVLEEVRASLHTTLQLIDAGYRRAYGDDARTIAWMAELARIEKTRHLRIHIQDAPETLLRLDLPPPEVNSTPPAVPAWFHWAVAPQDIGGEKELHLATGRPVRIRIEANPEDEIAEAWREALHLFGLFSTLAAGVALVVHVVLGRAFRPVGVILRGLGQIERGEYHTRIPRFTLPEFDRIATAINHAAEVLQQTRAENQRITQHSLVVQEEERRVIAQELHDELGQSISGIKALAASLRTGTDESGRGAIHTILATCDDIFASLRALMRRLRPSLLDEFGLVAALDDLVTNVSAHAPGITMEFRCALRAEDIPQASQIHLFRIAQEGLTNILRHASARRVCVTLRRAPPWIELILHDDGCGFDPGQARGGFGIPGIKERALSLGGRFQINSHPGTGTTLRIRVPGLEHPA